MKKLFEEIYNKSLQEMKGKVIRTENSEDYYPEWEESDVDQYLGDLAEALMMRDAKKIHEIAMNNFDETYGFAVEDIERDLMDEFGIEPGDEEWENLHEVTDKWWSIGEDVEYD